MFTLLTQSLSINYLIITEPSDFVLVSGERGTGKSSLIKVFSDIVRDRVPDILYTH